MAKAGDRVHPVTRAVTTAVLALGILLALAAGPAQASVSGSLSSGYWWQSQPAGSPLPPPPQVPSGGLWVSSNASGDQSISAIRFTVPAGQSPVTLTLHVHEAQPAAQVDVVACTTTSNWAPTGSSPGAWTSRPQADCSAGQTTGTLSPDGSTLSFDLAALVNPSSSSGGAGSDTLVDLVLEPGQVPSSVPSAVPGSPGNSSPTFDATFEPVTPDQVQLSGQPTAASNPSAPTSGATSTSGSGAGGSSGGGGQTYGSPVGLAAAIPSSAGLSSSGGPLGTTTLASPAAGTPGASAPAGANSSIDARGPAASAGGTSGPRGSGGRSWQEKILLSLVALDVGGYAIVSAEGGPRRALEHPRANMVSGRTARPPLSLYDSPELAASRLRVASEQAAAGPARQGRPPPLR